MHSIFASHLWFYFASSQYENYIGNLHPTLPTASRLPKIHHRHNQKPPPHSQKPPLHYQKAFTLPGSPSSQSIFVEFKEGEKTTAFGNLSFTLIWPEESDFVLYFDSLFPWISVKKKSLHTRDNAAEQINNDQKNAPTSAHHCSVEVKVLYLRVFNTFFLFK